MYFFILFFLLSSIVFSDQRLFVWTYQPMIEAAGEFELELYTTLKEPEKGESINNVWEHQIEIEAGISEKFDLSLYQVFEEKGNIFSFKGTKLRSRFMPYERGKKFLDFVLYLEYFKNKDFQKADKMEVKAIFGKKIGKFEWATNLTAEYKTSPSDKFEYILNFALTKKIWQNINLGFESFGIFEEEENQYYLGPTISILDHITFNFCFGLNNESDFARARLIIWINLS